MLRYTRITCVILALSLLAGMVIGWLGSMPLQEALAGTTYTQPVIAAPHYQYTALNVTDISRSGITATLTSAASGGNYFVNNGKVFLDVVNGSGSVITVTLITPRTVDGLAVADLAVPIAAGSEKFIGPFEPGTFNDDSGYTYAGYSAVTSVTVGAFRLP